MNESHPVVAHQKEAVYFIGETEMNKYNRLDVTSYKCKASLLSSMTCPNAALVSLRFQ